MTTPTMSSVSVGTASPQDKPADVPTQQGLSSDQKTKILTYVKQEFAKCKNSRSAVERQWYMNMAFYYGRQNVVLLTTAASTNGFRLYTPQAPAWRIRLIINKIRPIIRKELARITAEKPRFTVVPATTEDEDLAAARVSEQIFDSVYSAKNIQRVVRRAEWWTVICGVGFIKNYWDAQKPDLISNQKGDFCIEHVTPFHIFVPDLREEELENQPYVIHASTKALSWVKRQYPNMSVEPNTRATDDILDDSFLNIIGANSTSKDEVLCLEMWLKPGVNPLFPTGSLITLVGDNVVQATNGYPYDHGEFPFSKLEHIPSGKFYADSVITDLIPIQREYNRTRSQIVEAKNLMAKPKLMAPRGSINPNQITSEPGQVILYTPGFNPPAPLPLAPLPNYVMEELSQLQADMDDLSGQHDVPHQVSSATAMSFLKEQDDTMLAGTIESLETGIEKLGRQILSHVVQFWNTDRIVRVVGRDGTFEATSYKGGDLHGNLDVRVEAGSALPHSKAAKQAFVMDLLKLGVIQPQQGLEMLDIGGIEKIYDSYLVDQRQAQRENMRMSEGEQVNPNDFDNHALHIEIHNKFRKGQQFEAMPPEQQVWWQQHVALHQSAMQAAMAPPPGPMGGPPVGNPGAPDPNGGQLPQQAGPPSGPPTPGGM